MHMSPVIGSESGGGIVSYMVLLAMVASVQAAPLHVERVGLRWRGGDFLPRVVTGSLMVGLTGFSEG